MKILNVNNGTKNSWVKYIKPFLDSMIDVISGSFYIKDKKGVYLFCNNEVLQKGNLKDKTHIIGKTDYDVWPEKADSIRKNDMEAINKDKKIELEETVVLPNGKKMYFASIKMPLKDKNGDVLGIVCNSIDVTEAKQAQIAKTKFLENMRHDIRTPLTGIVGFANLIKEEANNETISEYADNLAASTNALLDFMNSILEVIRMDTDESYVLKNKFDLKKLLQSVVDLNKVKAVEKNIDLELIYGEDIPTHIMGDAKKIHWIIHELVANALKFTHEGSVKVSAILAGTENKEIIIKFIIEDTGIGISKEKIDDIFTQFSRVHPAYEGTYKGLGLGLTSVKKFIDALEGEIYVESSPHKGSVFTCIIPFKKPLLNDEFGASDITTVSPINAVSSQFSSASKPLIVDAYSSTETLSADTDILLVEDSEVAIFYTKALLNALGCKVDIAENGSQALIKAKNKKYDFIFMDVGLPDLSGYQVTKCIRQFEMQLDRHTPIVALTAHIEKENKEKCIKFGMDAVISKPLSKETAEDILNAFIPKRSDLRQIEDKNVLLDNKENLNLAEISGEIIDMSAEKFDGNIGLLKEMVTLLVDTFPEEIEALKAAYENNDYGRLKDLAHKIKGSAMYCGTIRLKIACANLEKYLSAGQEKHIKALYHQVLDEIESVRAFYKKLKI